MKKLLFLLIFLPVFGYSQIKVSEMTNATSVNDADYFLLLQSGSSKKVAFSVFDYNSTDAATQIHDSLTDYRVEVANQIHDSLPAGSSLSFGSQYQIPYTNSGADDFDYSANFSWNGTSLKLKTGTHNIFIGENSGAATTGAYNVFTGYNSGVSNITGQLNVFNGSSSGYSNTSGQLNVFLGNHSGYSNVTGDRNTFVGHHSGYNNTSTGNTFVGYYSGNANTSATGNVFTGYQTGLSNTGSSNSFYGYQSGYTNSSGGFNVFIGNKSGYANSTGQQNVLIGNQSGYSSTSSFNTMIGHYSGYSTTTGTNNVFNGMNAGKTNTTGAYNTFLGTYAGYSNVTGSRNTFIGYQVGFNETGSDKLYIDNSDTASPLIWGDFANDTVRINGYLDVTGGSSSISGSDNEILMSDGSGGTQTDASFNWNDTILYLQDHDRNVRIGSKDNPAHNDYSVYIGSNVGLSATGSGNVALGNGAGEDLTTGGSNILIGGGDNLTEGATNVLLIGGGSLTTGDDNIMIGSNSGFSNLTGGSNTFLGTQAGYDNTGDSSVFVGSEAGYNETGSNKLYIENSNSATPLIYGEFDNDIVKINGTQTQSTGTIADNDATPGVSAANVWTYNGTANAVTVTDLDNPDVGAIYRIIGNSDTYTITIADSGNFNLSAAWVGGIDDVLTIFVQADNDYIEISRSDN